MPKFTKKLTPDELKGAVDLLYAHYGKYFVENADDLAKEISEQFDCDCSPNEVYRYVNVRTIEEEDTHLLLRNIMQ
jgi:hypothetical protein